MVYGVRHIVRMEKMVEFLMFDLCLICVFVLLGFWLVVYECLRLCLVMCGSYVGR